MADRLMDDAAIGAALSGRSPRTGRRFREQEWDGAVYIVAGRKYIKESDFNAFLEARKLEPAKSQPINMKNLLRSISDGVLQKRRSA